MGLADLIERCSPPATVPLCPMNVIVVFGELRPELPVREDSPCHFWRCLGGDGILESLQRGCRTFGRVRMLSLPPSTSFTAVNRLLAHPSWSRNPVRQRQRLLAPKSEETIDSRTIFWTWGESVQSSRRLDSVQFRKAESSNTKSGLNSSASAPLPAHPSLRR